MKEFLFMPTLAIIFPGQGSQYIGMGKAFFDKFSEAKELFNQAEYISKIPIKRLCFEGPIDELTLTYNLQLSIVTVELIIWLILKKYYNIVPQFVAGHSLGEYPALVAANAFNITTCLNLINIRSKLMHRDAKNNPGTMKAIMGLSEKQVIEICNKINGIVKPANYNTPQQIVISGSIEAVTKAAILAKKQGGKIISLKVSGGWHSPLLKKADEEMANELTKINFLPLKCSIVPNATGTPTQNSKIAKKELIHQLIKPVYWNKTIESLINIGVDTFIEAGPKDILTNFIKNTNSKNIKTINIECPLDLQNSLDKLLPSNFK